MIEGSPAQTSERYGRYALGLFVLVFMLNLIDRQILSILAEDVKRDLGLSDPLVVQYFNWVKDILRGEFGHSFFRSESVADIGPTCGPSA